MPIPARQIEYLTSPAQVSMSDGYFELASLEHFWVRRRFEVFRKLAGDLVNRAREIAEIGCGQGLLQRQVEETYGRPVTGFDLNENGLKHNLSQCSRVICYDVFQRAAEFEQRFDLIFLWDVLEHIGNEDSFLQAVRFHLARGGNVVFNVPAGEWAFSGYDTAAGHFRRYSKRSFLSVIQRNGLQVTKWTYWGLPLMPTLLFRRLFLPAKEIHEQHYSRGFGAGNRIVNDMLGVVARLEIIPQGIGGTSLMTVVR
jgi:2-polyprenyl-3-methyl-5-hydroxy-6-metoxy-1,4-benzoquinol methylase